MSEETKQEEEMTMVDFASPEMLNERWDLS